MTVCVETLNGNTGWVHHTTTPLIWSSLNRDYSEATHTLKHVGVSIAFSLLTHFAFFHFHLEPAGTWPRGIYHTQEVIQRSTSSLPAYSKTQNITFWYQEWNIYIYPTTNRSDPPQSVQEMLGARQQFLLWFMDLPVLLSARCESMGCVIDALECWKLSHGGQQNILQHPSQLALSPADMHTNEMNWTSASRCLTSHVQDKINPSRLKRLFLSSIKCLSVWHLSV